MMAGLVDSFRYAGRGILSAIRTERNFRIQLLVGTVALVLGVAVKITAAEFATISLTCALVLSLELVNTALEAYLDRFQPEHDEAVGQVKDLMAGAVLVSAVGGVAVGAAIFVPSLVDWV
jgi:diacylglycerol kinase